MRKGSKSTLVRKEEILDAADALFAAKGYEHTSVDEILGRVGITRGTLYYHFRSKEEILAAAVNRHVEGLVLAAAAIAADTTLDAEQKLRCILGEEARRDKERRHLFAGLYSPGNAELHLRVLGEGVRRYAPILAAVVEQGVGEGSFFTSVPRTAAEFLLVGYRTLLDPRIFPSGAGEFARRSTEVVGIMERVLGAREGSFAYLADLPAYAGFAPSG